VFRLSNTWSCGRLLLLFDVVQRIPWVVGCLRGPLAVLRGLCRMYVGMLLLHLRHHHRVHHLTLASKLCIQAADFVLWWAQVLRPVTLGDLVVLQKSLSNFSFVHMGAADDSHLGTYHYIKWNRKGLKSCSEVLDLGCVLRTNHAFLLNIAHS